MGMISGYPTVVPRIRQARVAHGGGGGDSPPGGPVAVDLMEEVQLRNKAGRISKTKPTEVPEPKWPRRGYRNRRRRSGYRILDVHGM